MTRVALVVLFDVEDEDGSEVPAPWSWAERAIRYAFGGDRLVLPAKSQLPAAQRAGIEVTVIDIHTVNGALQSGELSVTTRQPKIRALDAPPSPPSGADTTPTRKGSTQP